MLQIQATLVKGKARIVFSHVKVSEKSFGQISVHALINLKQGESYTLAKAQHAYKSLVKIHEKSGK